MLESLPPRVLGVCYLCNSSNLFLDAISHAGQVGIQSTVKIATGVASSTTGKLVSDGIDISAGRKGIVLRCRKILIFSEQTDLGQNIGVSIITGSTGAILSVAGEATSKVAEHVAGKFVHMNRMTNCEQRNWRSKAHRL